MHRLLLLFFALVFFMSSCAQSRIYTAPILLEDLASISDIAGRTVCSYNNLPVSQIDYHAWDSWVRELIIIHENIHANDMIKYKGGCWAFIYKYNEDKNFALKAEYKAYCIEGRAALERNINPKEIWDRIKNALVKIDSVRANQVPNCIY